MVEEKIIEGYKNTEVGVIPEDWKVTSLEDVADKKTPWALTGGPFGSNLKTDDYTNSGVRIIQLQNIGDGQFHDDNKIYTSIEKANELISCNIYPGDIILSKMGDPVARACIIPENEERYLMASDGIRLVVDEKNYSKKFILYYINYDIFRRIADEASTGTTRKRINILTLKKLPIVKPLIQEQNAIGGTLTSVDSLIHTIKKLIDKKKKIKQGTMQQLLTGKKRLPGFSGEWEVKTLGSIATISKGQLITEKDAINGPIPVIAGGISPSYYHNKANRLGKTITISASGANAGYVGFHKQPIFASDCSTINEGAEYNIEFIYYQLKLLQEKIYSSQTGGAQPHIHPKDIKPLLIDFAEKNEQIAISNVLLEMDSEIEALELKLKKYKKIKQGMMQELLTGRIRLV